MIRSLKIAWPRWQEAYAVTGTLEMVCGLTLCAIALARCFEYGPGSDFASWCGVASLVCMALALSMSSRPTHVVGNFKTFLAVALSVAPGFIGHLLLWDNTSEVLQTAKLVRCFYDLVGIATIFSLGRNMGIFPGLRGISTRGMYRFLRHPLYAIYVHIQLLAVILDPSPQQFLLLLLVVTGIGIRIAEEEKVLSRVNTYKRYTQLVPARLFHPGFSLPIVGLGIVKLFY